MKVTSFKKHLVPCLSGLALALFLSACTSTESQAPSKTTDLSTAQAFSSLSSTPAEYRKLLETADAANRFPAMILLARSSIVARDFQTAASLISSLQQEATTPLQFDEATIIEALLKLHQGQQQDARYLLNKINVAQLPRPVASFFYQLSSSIEISLYNKDHDISHIMRSCEDKITLLNYINTDSRKTVCQQIVDSLQHLPPAELTKQQEQATNPTLRGFIEYALINSSSSPNVKKQLLNDWSTKYKDHPMSAIAVAIAAGQAVDEEGNIAQTTVTPLKEGDKLAVLLPLTGRFAENVGEPARLGILAALQDRNSALHVTFYDTNRMNMSAIMAALNKNQTDFIIGPILKPEVDALISAGLHKPAIVFNQPATAIPNLFFFNLGPDYEGALAATRIGADGHIRPVVIAPESTRGQRSTNGFTEVWSENHTSPAMTCRFKERNTIDSDLVTCPLSSADSIYLHATAAEAIKAKGVLPRSVPLYLTDRSFMGLNHSSGESVLTGSFLGDMPWLLTDSALKQDLMATLPKADSQIQRIFASAYDSINLAFNLQRLEQDPKDVLRGISGDLQLNKNGQIEMRPMWVKLGVDRPLR